jgi:peptidoglycan/xylan/chitin deacetylase (PgdA/CDA1 family)
MSVRSQLGVLRKRLLCSVHTRPVSLNNSSPAVSFCFDDFPRSAYVVGGPVLKQFGAHGTYYTSLGLMNTSNELGDQFRSYDIEPLLADGHELGCHTFSHYSCRNVSRHTFEDDVYKGREAVEKMSGSSAANFAYPYGHVTAQLKKRIGSRMTSCRGIYAGINQTTADLNLLRANSLYGDVDQFAGAKTLLSQVGEQGGWLIFYTHDVRPNPSPFGCTPALLEKCVSAAAKMGFSLISVGKMLELREQKHYEVP